MTVHITNTLEPAVGEDKILSITQIYFKDEGGKESGGGVIEFGSKIPKFGIKTIFLLIFDSKY